MRPVRLEMRAFGPYADTQVIDFRDLEHRSLLLVHGPTGAGKTTIFDAICFALYGTGSCDRREGRAMRSHHSDPRLLTEVTLDFALGPETYRVSRRPEQERPKLRGDGFVTEKSQATLWRRTGAASDTDEGTPVATQWKNVTEEVTRLFGFESDQFRQVVMLPQGEFQRLLLSDSAQREDILEVLFQTVRYRWIEEHLKEQARTLTQQVKDLQQRQHLILQQAGAQTMAEFAAHQQQLDQQIEDTAAAIELLRRDREAAEQARAQGYIAVNRLREAAEAESHLQSLLAQSDEIAGQRRLLDRALAASRLSGAEQSLLEREREAKSAQQEESKASTDCTAATQRKQQADLLLQTEQARDTERIAAGEECRRLDEIASRAAELIEAQRIVRESTRTRNQWLTQQEDRRTASAKAGEVREQLRQQLAERQQFAAQAEALGERVQSARQRLQWRRQWEKARQEEVRAQQVATQATAAADSAESLYQQAQTAWEQLQNRWLDGQASVLAQRLQDGSPCPVCGSLDHPQPAAADRDTPSGESIRQHRTELQRRTKERDDSQREAATAQNTFVQASSRAALLSDQLGEHAALPLKEIESACAREEQAWQQAQEASRTLDTIRQDLTRVEEDHKQLQRQAEEAAAQAQESSLELGRAQAICQEREAAVPEPLRDPRALQSARERARAREKELHLKLQQAQQEWQVASEQLASCTAHQTRAAQAAQQALDRWQREQHHWDAMLMEQGFVSIEDYRQAKLPADDLQKRQQLLDQYQSDLLLAKDRAVRTRAAAEDCREPDMSALETAFTEAERALQERVQQQAEQTARRKQFSEWQRHYAELSQQGAEWERQHAVIGRMAEVASGKNELGITFQRFVQARLLDEVLTAATLRLERMSGGRYKLKRSLTRQDKRTLGGLDLEVYDSYTDRSRPAATLSGGETFLASLCLALGLADVVQRYAGGRFVEAIFVDEGFGSLDPETLDVTLHALIQLQQGGRLVGIISHVPELKERIDARLEVTPIAKGSVARLVIGDVRTNVRRAIG